MENGGASVLSGHLSARLDRIETTMATEKDVQQLEERVASRMDGLDGRMDRLDGRMDRLEVTLKTTLEVVQSIDRHLAELAPLKTLPERISWLEDEVLKLKTGR